MRKHVVLGLLREYIQLTLREAAVNLKPPQNSQEAKAFVDLLNWAANKMQVPGEEVQGAVTKAKKGDWKDALELMSIYYVMKGIPFKGAN